ncbi:MAG: hypothetical protein WKG07_18450 [Hymenobacter sp.]
MGDKSAESRRPHRAPAAGPSQPPQGALVGRRARTRPSGGNA